MLLLLFFFLIKALCFHHRANAECIIDVNFIYSQETSPLLLNPNTNTILYPGLNQHLRLGIAETILVACPDGTLDFSNLSYMFLTCNALGNLIYEGMFFNSLNTVKCQVQQWGQVIETGEECGISGEELLIGSEIGPNTYFLPFLVLCFDKTSDRTIYTMKELSHSRVKTYVFTSKNWNPDKNITHFTHLLETEERAIRVNRLVGLDDMSDKYVSNEYTLELRALTEQYECEHEFIRRVTYRYLNSFHFWRDHANDCHFWDWKHFNYNYMADFLEKLGTPLRIYTGIYGVGTLPNVQTGQAVELNLYDVDGKPVGPVASLLWKLLYEPISKRAVVLMLTNEHISQRTELLVCPPVDELIEWAKFDKCSGIYACRYSDAIKAVPNIPSLPVLGLLNKA